MLKFIVQLLPLIMIILKRIFSKRDKLKTADELLETNYTKKAEEAADAAADEKYDTPPKA